MIDTGWLLLIFAFAVFTAIVAVRVWKTLADRRRTLSAELNAQIARESDELDLDKRMGPKEFISIESKLYPTDSSNSQRLQIAYRQTGHGRDIICLHGIGASMVIFRRLVPWLANDYRITCVDFLGFGSSVKPRSFSYTLDEQATHLEQAIEALKLDRPLAIASSMGAAISLMAALSHPELFRGLVALAPAVDPKRVPLVLLPLAKYGDRLHRVNSLGTVRAALAQVLSRRELITPALVALYQEPFRDQGDSSSAFLKAFALLADSRMPRIFAKLDTPLLIIRGLRDRLVKQAACEDLHRIVKKSKLITHPSAGHHIMEDEPEFVAIEIRKFDRDETV